MDLCTTLAAMLRDFVGTRKSGLVFREQDWPALVERRKDRNVRDGDQFLQRDILKYSLHPTLRKLGMAQGGLYIFRRFRITAMELAGIPQALQHTWSGHAATHVSEDYKLLLEQREWRLEQAEKVGLGFSVDGFPNVPRVAQQIKDTSLAASLQSADSSLPPISKRSKLIQFRKVG